MNDPATGSGPLVIRAAWVVPVDRAFRVIRGGEVVIDAGRVVSVGPAGHRHLPGARVMDFPHHALLPGLVNAHTHVAGCLFRGLTEDRADGFYGLALPMERHYHDEAIYTLSRLGIAEVLLAGCTVINEIYHGAAETARAAVELGIRAHVAHKVFDTDLASIKTGERLQIPEEGERRLQENIDLYDKWNGAGNGRVQVRFGAHAADTCSVRLLAAHRGRKLSAGVPGATSTSPRAPKSVTSWSPRTAPGRSSSSTALDFLGPDVVVAHVVYATPAGIETLARDRHAGRPLPGDHRQTGTLRAGQGALRGRGPRRLGNRLGDHGPLGRHALWDQRRRGSPIARSTF